MIVLSAWFKFSDDISTKIKVLLAKKLLIKLYVDQKNKKTKKYA
jgi:hypothetical protein